MSLGLNQMVVPVLLSMLFVYCNMQYLVLVQVYFTAVSRVLHVMILMSKTTGSTI